MRERLFRKLCVLLGIALWPSLVFAAPPVISAIPDQTIGLNTATTFLPFSIGDAETAATSLLLSASSTNVVLVPTNRIAFSGSGSNRLVRVTPATNQIGTSRITVTVVDTANETASTSFLVTVTNGPPTITDIANRMINPGITSSFISFVVFDRETSPSNLVVRGVSSNTNLVANQNIFLGGSGSNRNVRVLPAMQLGLTTISLTVTDVIGASASDSFDLVVSNARPYISYLGGITGVVNSASPQQSFTVGDLETAAAQLALSGYSSNTALIADSNILFGGTGSNRWVSVTPAINQVGNTLLGVVVSDQFDGRATNYLTVSISQFGEITNSLPGVSYPSMAWGDYDRDGLLDFAYMGYGPSTNVIFHNLGNGVFMDIGANLLGVGYGALAWADYDSDGDLDLLAAGSTDTGTNAVRLYRNDTGTFNTVPTALPALAYAGLAWGDYDNDGDADLLLAGSSNNVPVTRIFRNDSGILVDSGIELSPVSSAVAAWGDYDNDGDLDLFLSGGNGNYAQARIYRNAGNGNFINIAANITGLVGGSAEWGDYDGDGDLDVLLHGGDNRGAGYTVLIRNEGGDQFTQPSVGLDYLARTGASWGDYDNDGDLDIALGYRYESFATHFYRNDGGIYVNSSNNVLGLGQGALAWGDYDNDGRLDLLQTGERDYPTYGRTTRLFRNYGPLTNSPPAQPTNFTAVVSGRTVRLNWAPSADANQSVPLTYNLRVGTAPGAGNLLSPQSLADGRRLRPAQGNVFLNNSWFMQNLSPGTYYASVQAVDNGFAGSPFSAEISFTVANPPGQPSARTEAPTGVTFTDAIFNGSASPNGLTATAWFEFGSTTNYGSRTSSVSIGNTTNYLPFTQPVTGLAAATPYYVRLVVANSAGTNRGQSRLFSTLPFTAFSELTSVLPEPAASGGRWVDFDRDGDLDVMSATVIRNNGGVFTNTGVTISNNYNGFWGDYNNDNFPDLLVSRSVELNNLNGTFTTVPLTLALTIPDYAAGASAWGDYDGDGDADLLITGQTIFYEYYNTTLFRNDGNFQFTSITNGLPAALNSAPGWLDYDNDGWLDLFLPNFRFTSQPMYLFRNIAGQSFIDSGAALIGTEGTSRDWADYDNDGDLDLIIGPATRLFRNEGGGVFSEVSTNFPASAQLSWGDYDNDGDPDLLIITYDPVYFRSAVVWRNDAGSFSDIGTKINGATAAYWGDFDRDGDLDILASGTLPGSEIFARVYRNNSLVSNAPPAAPTGLHSSLAGKAVILGWNKPADPNQTNGWSFNLRVSATPGGVGVLSPLANPTNGYRYVPRFGNAGVGTSWVLTNLPVGTYYWSVQAVDHSLAGSPFAAEQTFTVPPWPPDIVSTWATNPTLSTVTLAGRVNPNNRPTTVWFQYGVTTNYGQVSTTRSLAAVNSELTTNVLITSLAPFATYHYRMVASNQLGLAYGPDQTFATVQYTAVPTTFDMPETWSGLWADLDTDGILDAFINGFRPSTYGGYFHHNNGSGVFTTPTPPLPFAYSGVWALPLDRDEDLDLLIPGGYLPFYFNNGAAQFVNSTNSVGFESSVLLPADIDNDGDIDVLVTGYDGFSSTKKTVLFTNDGAGIFRDSQFQFIASSSGVGAWADTDGDGDLDLAFCGNAGQNSTNFSRLYRNDGVLGFTPLTAVFNPVSAGSMCWSDYDNDGDLDLFLTGYGTNGQIARIYRRNGPNSFSEVDPGIIGFSSSSAQWGDFDNDGKPDLLLTGYTNNSSPATLIYRNLGGDQFELVPSSAIPGVFGGNAEWGDYDRDGDLDILLAGRYVPASLYRNNAITSNAIPQPPINLASMVINGNSARLSWQPGTDANQNGGHTFSLRVGTSPGANNVINPLAVWPGGARRVTGPGNVQLATNWLLKSLSPGTYYWSVQAVDHSLAGSAFAAEKSFTVLPFTQPPSLGMLPTTNVEFFTAELRGQVNPNGVASIAWFEYGLTTNYGNATPALPIGNGTNWLTFTQWASNLVAETTYYWRLVGSNLNGVAYGFDQTFTTPAYTLFNQRAQLPDFQQGTAAWGDYDNDGDLDLLFTGLTSGSGSGTKCQIYRNDSGVFSNVPLSLTGSWMGDAAWGDYDNDGDLDIVTAGNSLDVGNMARIYRNDGSNLFTSIAVTLPAVYQGTMAWADFDRDGDLDLVIASSSGSIVYRNEGHDTFLQKAVLQTVSSAALGVADFDNDGDLDILMTGYSSGAGTRLYVNDGRANFTLLNTALPAVSDGGIAWGDVDNDGDLDVALVGNRWSSPSAYLAGVYRNDGNGVFTDLQANLPGVEQSSCAWGDYDNDGDLDFLMTGFLLGASGTSKIFRNDTGSLFTDIGPLFQPTYNGRAVWGDYDNDGDLDFVQVGSGFTRIYRNNATNANLVAAAPSNLSAIAAGDAVLLSWVAPADPNQSGGLTYNVRVGTAPGAIDVLSPMANVATGFRRLPHLGNAGTLTWLWLTNLPAGTYYWSVQTVDHALAGSPFATEATFSLAARAPDAFTTPATNVTITTATLTGYAAANGAPAVAWFQYGVNSYTSSTPAQVIGSGSGQIPVSSTITNLIPGSLYHFRLAASNSLGTSFGIDQTFVPPMFTELSTPFAQVKPGSVMWGDYDADGDLDLVLTGDTTNFVNSTVSRIYRNNGNSTFTDLGLSLSPAVFPGNWGDFDNDGDLDLLLGMRLYRNEATDWSLLGSGLPQLAYPATAWGDFDNDGKLDILFAGFAGGSGSTSRVAQIYRNLGGGFFTNSGVSMQGVENASVAWGDYDNDGDLDVLRTGFNTGNVRDSRIYRNNGNGTFSSIGAFLLPGVTAGSGVWGDYDNDGDLDILLTGETSTNRIAKVFVNQGNDVFTDTGLTLPGIVWGTAQWVDYDNDGDLDIFLSGQTATGLVTKLYRQLGGGLWTDSQIDFPGLTDAAAAWGDFDNDGDLDLVLLGYDANSTRITRLYRNNCRVANTPPSAPSGLTSTVTGNSVRFDWLAASDPNQMGGLSYNLRVGTSPGAANTVASMANPSTGRRYVARLGNAQLRTSWTITNLPPGTYFWSVQTIDHSFAGSPFAAQASFVITNHPPIAQSQLIILGEDSAQPITLTATDPDVQTLTYSLLASATNGTLSGAPPNLTYRPATNFFGADAVVFRVQDPAASASTGTVSLIVTQVLDVAGSFLAMQTQTNGQPVLTFTGEPFERYQIQASSDLLHWSTLTNVSSSDGIVKLILADAAVFPKRFYRAALTLPPATIQFPRLIPATGFTLDFSGELARVYQVQASSDLTNWTTLTNLLMTASPAGFTDSTATNFSRRFYRVYPLP